MKITRVLTAISCGHYTRDVAVICLSSPSGALHCTSLGTQHKRHDFISLPSRPPWQQPGRQSRPYKARYRYWYRFASQRSLMKTDSHFGFIESGRGRAYIYWLTGSPSIWRELLVMASPVAERTWTISATVPHFNAGHIDSNCPLWRVYRMSPIARMARPTAKVTSRLTVHTPVEMIKLYRVHTIIRHWTSPRIVTLGPITGTFRHG